MKIEATVNGKTKTFDIKGIIDQNTIFKAVKREFGLWAPIMQIDISPTNQDKMQFTVYDELAENITGSGFSV
jgi:hypothetical protein